MLGNSEHDGLTTTRTIKMKKMMTMAIIMLIMMITSDDIVDAGFFHHCHFSCTKTSA